MSFTSFSFPSFSEGVFFHLQSLTKHQEESPKSWRWSEELTNALHLMMPWSRFPSSVSPTTPNFYAILAPAKVAILTDGGSELTTTPPPHVEFDIIIFPSLPKVPQTLYIIKNPLPSPPPHPPLPKEKNSPRVPQTFVINFSSPTRKEKRKKSPEMDTATDGPDPSLHVSHRTVELPTVESRQQQVRQKQWNFFLENE